MRRHPLDGVSVRGRASSAPPACARALEHSVPSSSGWARRTSRAGLSCHLPLRALARGCRRRRVVRRRVRGRSSSSGAVPTLCQRSFTSCLSKPLSAQLMTERTRVQNTCNYPVNCAASDALAAASGAPSSSTSGARSVAACPGPRVRLWPPACAAPRASCCGS